MPRPPRKKKCLQTKRRENRERKQQRRQNETTEQTEARRQKERERAARKRRAETTEQTEARRLDNRKRVKRRRRVETKKEAEVKIEETSQDTEKSDYEKMIQENRARSLAFLESLKLDEINESYCKAVQDLKPKRIKRPAPSAPSVLRKSSRITENIDFSESAMKEKATKKYSDLPKVLKFEEALKNPMNFSNFIQEFSELDCKRTEISYEIMTDIRKMKIQFSQVARWDRSLIRALTIHPVHDKIIIATGNEHGHVGFWNMNTNQKYVFNPHIASVTNLMFNPYDSNEIVSSSDDKTMRCGDMEKLIFEEVNRVSNGWSCSCFDVLSKDTFVVGNYCGGIAVVDKRAKSSVKISPSSVSSAIKSVCIHPVDKNYFISSERKGKIKLWDMRKPQKPVVVVKRHQGSVTSAFFSPLTGNSILSTSVDNSLCIFDCSNLSGNISVKKSIKLFSGPPNKCKKRWLSALKAVWVPNTDDNFVVGSMRNPKRIELYNVKGNKIFNFVGKDLVSPTSLHAFHPSLPVLAGASYSGNVFVFKDT